MRPQLAPQGIRGFSPRRREPDLGRRIAPRRGRPRDGRTGGGWSPGCRPGLPGRAGAGDARRTVSLDGAAPSACVTRYVIGRRSPRWLDRRRTADECGRADPHCPARPPRERSHPEAPASRSRASWPGASTVPREARYGNEASRIFTDRRRAGAAGHQPVASVGWPGLALRMLFRPSAVYLVLAIRAQRTERGAHGGLALRGRPRPPGPL